MAVILLNKKEWTKDGRKWIFYTRYKNLSGKTKQYKSKKFLNKKEAIEAERIFFLQLDKYRPDNDMTFKDLYTAFYEYQQDKVKETTLNTYKDRMRYMALLDNIKCKEFNLQHYEAWRKKILEYKLANRTRNYIYKFLKTIMNFGTKWYGINLMRFYKKIEFFKDPNEMKEEKDVYTFEEFQKYITGASNLNDKTMFEMLYYCGLRRGECRGLQWSDIDWNNKLVSITKQANSVKDSQKYYELTPPKTQKSIRTLPLTDVLYNDLVNLYNEKKKYYGFNEKWFIFGELDPLTFGMMHRINKRIAESADIRRIPLHSFRHSCASLLINTGQPVTTVSKYLGHASTKETLDTYAHMFPNNLTNVKNTIDNLNLGI